MKTITIGFTCATAFGLAISVYGGEPSPNVTIVLGNLLPEEDGSKDASQSPLRSPFGIDFDTAGNMIIVELEGGRVHRLSPDGDFYTIAGDGSKSYSGDGGPALKATFNGMHNVAVAPNDDIYIADSWNHCIRKIDAKSKTISTIAGTGKAGYSGDGGPAIEATFNFVMCITLSPSNDELFIADLNNRRIRAVSLKTAVARTVAGNGQRGIPKDDAIAVESPLVDPRAVTVDSKGQVYILERGGHALRVVSPDGKIRTVAGTGTKGYADGPALEAQFASPKHVCTDDKDNLYIADDGNQAIRKFDPQSSSVTTVVGRRRGKPAVSLKRPHGICFEQGKLFVVDTGNNRILRLD